MATRVIYRFEVQTNPHETMGLFQSGRRYWKDRLYNIGDMPGPKEDHDGESGIYVAIESKLYHYGFSSILQAANVWETDKQFVLALKQVKAKLRAYEVDESDCILLRNQAMFRKDKAKRFYRVPMETLTRVYA